MPLRVTIPGILIVTVLLNAGLRFFPPDRVALRSWEAATLFVTRTGPFAPGKRYYNPAATGDLGTLANLPEYRRPHEEKFTTGVHGYREYEPGVDPPPKAILFGDSFGAGASLSDSDYLCHRLNAVFGGPTFFGGYYFPKVVSRLRTLPRTPYVIIQLSERYNLNDTAGSEPLSAANVVRRIAPEDSTIYLFLRYLKDLMLYSPLEIWAGRIYRLLQNDVILPNIHAENVRIYSLRNGTEMLFLRSEVPQYYSPPPVNIISSVAAVQRGIQAQGAGVIVLIVPNKFTVYYPLLKNAPAGPPESELYVNVLERKLRNAGVKVINLTRDLRLAAAEQAESGNVIYRVDDTHWNPTGVMVAAQAIQRQLNFADRDRR